MKSDIKEIGLHLTGAAPNGTELSRLVTAAVINQKFRDLLLSDPKLALAAGYKGEVFRLTPEEYYLILSIRATSLTDFARQLTGNRNGHGNGYAHNGHANGISGRHVNLREG
jgi:hypothetical protein